MRNYWSLIIISGIDCGEIDPPTNGYIMGVGTLYEDVIRYNCEKGFAPIGPTEAICEASGSWSNKPPKCQGIIKSSMNKNHLWICQKIKKVEDL